MATPHSSQKKKAKNKKPPTDVYCDLCRISCFKKVSPSDTITASLKRALFAKVPKSLFTTGTAGPYAQYGASQGAGGSAGQVSDMLNNVCLFTSFGICGNSGCIRDVNASDHLAESHGMVTKIIAIESGKERNEHTLPANREWKDYTAA